MNTKAVIQKSTRAMRRELEETLLEHSAHAVFDARVGKKPRAISGKYGRRFYIGEISPSVRIVIDMDERDAQRVTEQIRKSHANTFRVARLLNALPPPCSLIRKRVLKALGITKDGEIE